MEKTHTKGTSFQEGPGLGHWGKILKSGPLTMHFQHSGAKIRVFEQNTDIIKSTSTSTILLRKTCTASREGSVYQG